MMKKSKILIYNYCLIYLYWIYMLIIPPDAYLGSKLVPNSSFNCKHCPTIFCFQSEQFLSTTVWQHFNFQSWTNWQKAASTPCHVVPQQEVWKVKTAKFISQGRHFFPRQLSVFSEDFICHLQWVQHIYLLKEVVFADGVSFKCICKISLLYICRRYSCNLDASGSCLGEMNFKENKYQKILKRALGFLCQWWFQKSLSYIF